MVVKTFLSLKKNKKNETGSLELFNWNQKVIQLKDSEEEKVQRVNTNKVLGKNRRVNNFQRLEPSPSSASQDSFDKKARRFDEVTFDEMDDAIALTAQTLDIDEQGFKILEKSNSKATNKMKLKFKQSTNTKGSKKFRKLDNIEGSHASDNVYQPPIDYNSIVGSDVSSRIGMNTTLKLLNFASQSYQEQISSPFNVTPSISSLLEKPVGSPEDNIDDKKDVEFRQFVFDKNFKKIEAVNVEKSDSGTGAEDFFRMAAVETVNRIALDKLNSPEIKSVKTNKLPSLNPRRLSSPKMKSKSLGVFPMSPHIIDHKMNKDSTPPLKKPALLIDSRANNKSREEHVELFTNSEANFEISSKNRFQELVKKRGTFQSVRSENSITNPKFSSFIGQSSQLTTASYAVHNSSNYPKEGTFMTTFKSHHPEDKDWIVFPTEQKLSLGPKTTKIQTISRSDPENPLSPLRTYRHFGNTSSPLNAFHHQVVLPSLNKFSESGTGKPKNENHISASPLANAGSTIETNENAGYIHQIHLSRHPQLTTLKQSTTNNIFSGMQPAHLDKSPFHIGTDDDDPAWNFSSSFIASCDTRHQKPMSSTGSTISSGSRGDNSLLIESIQMAYRSQKASDRHHAKRSDAHRPDPSPRESVHHSSSDSMLDFIPIPAGGRSNKDIGLQEEADDNIYPSLSESAMDYHDHQMDNKQIGQAASINLTSSTTGGHSRKSSAKILSGVPEHAILASMLFRQTELSQRIDQSSQSKTSQDSSTSKKVTFKSPQRRSSVTSEQNITSKRHFDVPSVVQNSSAASSVSSVTEEASIFYHKNLQSNHFKSQAFSALNNYHCVRATQQKQQKQQQSLSNHANSTESSTSKIAATSAIGSRKATASERRPTWLDRVEEEHMRMFN